jgi:transcriptional regulator with XRE-family HTH domain
VSPCGTKETPASAGFSSNRIENYLKTHRKKSGLTQQEVAFLLGCDNAAQVSRCEKRRRLPPLETALACEAIFGVPIAELFAGMRKGVGKIIEKRRLELRTEAQMKNSQGSAAQITAHKLRWLADHEGTLVADQNFSVS